MKFSTIAIASLLLASFSSFAVAQSTMSGPPAGGGRMAACRDDAQKFCADKTGAERRACLQQNMASLSESCKTAMNAMSNRSSSTGGMSR